MTTKKQVNLESPRPFSYDDESKGSAGVRWPRGLKDFELFLVGSNIDDKDQKKAILLHVYPRVYI
jgi:hypothetical protein